MQNGLACAEKAAENCLWQRELLALHIRCPAPFAIYDVPGSRWRSHSMAVRVTYSNSDFGALTARQASM